MVFNPFRPLAVDQIKRVVPYEAVKPEHSGFEGVRVISSESSEDLKDLLTFNPNALFAPSADRVSAQEKDTEPDLSRFVESKGGSRIDRIALAESVEALDRSPVGKEDSFLDPMDYLKQEQIVAVMEYLAYLSNLEEFREPGALTIYERMDQGLKLSVGQQVQLMTYLHGRSVFLP